MPDLTPVRVVLLPEALGEALLVGTSRELLLAWREGRIRPVVCRGLLLRYFRLLRGLSLPERLIRWWGWWLASPKKVAVFDDPPAHLPLFELCQALALRASAPFLVGRGELPTHPSELMSHEAPPRWVTCRQLLEELAGPGSEA